MPRLAAQMASCSPRFVPPKPLIILHGWSDNSASFRPLAKWLQGQGFQVVDIWLGDYISMHDKLKIEDIGFAFQRALDANGIPQTRYSFDLIIHSTGALVAREYLRQVCTLADGTRDAQRTPIRHLAMLAPANFGSPLAGLGKSVIGRILKGWRWDDLKHAGESGQRILEALELASPYSFRLGLDDLFDPTFPVLSSKNTITTVLVGTAPYDGNRKIMHEAGSDGTVRVATANLNATYLSVDFADPANPVVSARPRTSGDIAFAVFDRNHGTITQPPGNNLPQEQEWTDILLRALNVTAAGYAGHVTACAQQTDALYSAREAADPNFHRYMHVVFHVHDQFGAPVPDYVIDFFQRVDPKDHAYRAIQGDILEKVNTHSVDSSYRSFFFDCTDLEAFLAKFPASEIEMSVGAAPVSDDIIYRNPDSKDEGVSVFSGANKRLLHPNEPVLVDVTLHRDPEAKVFRLKKA